MEELRREIRGSIAQLDAGQGIPAATVRERVQQRRDRNKIEKAEKV
jgi:hypothetical protein